MNITMQGVASIVAKEFDVPVGEVFGPSHRRAFARPRQAVYLICRDDGKRSLPEIGAAIGRRDHTTILSGIRAARKWMETDAESAAKVEAARKRIEELNRQIEEAKNVR